MSNLESGQAMRRAVLGDAYVDAQTTEPNTALGEFQDYITETAWGVWARNDTLTVRDRSLIVLSITAALGRMEEFALHLSSQPRTGVTDAEVDELVSRSPPTAELRRRGRQASRRSLSAPSAPREGR